MDNLAKEGDNMITCIASDMDGTLLNGKQQISEENQAAIRQAQNAGIEFVIATGRSYQEVSFLLKETGITCPVICTNGAEIRSESGEIIASYPLEKTMAKEIADFLNEKEMFFEVYTNKGVFVKDYDKGIELIMNIFASAHPHFNKEQFKQDAKERIEKGKVHVVENYDSLLADPSIEILKYLAFSLNKEMLTQVDEDLKNWEVAVSSSGYDNLEITNIQAQKGIALESFVQSRGITLDETMAIGDSYNDLSMFSRVGRAVAMGNANAEIKANVNEVTATNEENGVAKAILQVLQVGKVK